ncbi:MAG: hypothetical protein HDS46_01050 [Bacteroides sp.]|nr:hypothetical protein [Bacteroides sp.]
MTSRIIYSFLSAIILLAQCANAAAPAGYYSSLTGKSSSTLKTALHDIINPHTQVSSYNNLPTYFRQTDTRKIASNPGVTYWWDMYSDMDVDVNIQFGTYMNREHSLPKSWWGGLTNIPAYTDLNHLYPGEARANQAKSNYPLGEIKAGETPSFDNGISKVGVGVNSGSAAKVFEPANEYKGDFARTYFYMVTCYQDLNWTNTWQVMNGVYPSLQQWSIDLLLKWHRADPVSQKEIDRNEAVFKIQNNRNPFIDDPELAEYIWGNKKGQAYQPSTTTTPSGDADLFTPVNGMYLDFGQVAIGHSLTSRLIFRGENITGTFELNLIGLNRSLFALSTDQINGNLCNTTSGTYATVTYTPNAIGSHTARVSITDGSLPLGQSYDIWLTAECLEKPILSALTATAPTDVTRSTYVARWDAPPADEVVDYYVVTLKRFKNGVATTSELLAEADSLEIDGLDLGDYDSYAVQSVRLEERSPISNYVDVQPTASIDQILSDSPLAIEGHDGFIRFRCAADHTDIRIFDTLGRTIALIDRVSDYFDQPLPPGVYLVATAEHPRPVKVRVR